MKTLLIHALLYAFALILLPTASLATQPTSIAITAVLVTVNPENAPQNTPRTITVKTSGAFFCLPLFGVMNSTAVDDANVLTITFPNFAPGFVFPTPPAVAVCPAIVASVEQSFQFTPTKAGVIKVRALQTNGPISGQASILTSPKGETRGFADVSGMYYDNSTNGSGLALHHNAQGTTSGLFGTWFAYDTEGKPRWLTIQETRWETTDILVGNLYETKANANQCSPNSPLCIARFSSIQKVGTVRINFFILRPLDDVIRPTEVKAIGLDGATMFSSSVYRLPL